VGPYDDEKLGFFKVAKLYYYPGWWEPGPALTFLVGQRAWDQLPKQYQEIFQVAASYASTAMQVAYDQKNAPALQRLLKEGVQLKPFSPEIMSAARSTSQGLLEEYAAKDASYRAVYDHWNQARKDLFSWFGTAELAYSRFAYGS
jgi:TRAP-type mannitol/chloroaromatic compound transport system substrate-binding protein